MTRSMPLPHFKTRFEPHYGEPVKIAPNVQRITAPNAGPMTFHGTNTYIVGTESVAVIDPGPDDPHHLDALTGALAGQQVSHIVVTHTHHDHCALARPLSARTGAPVWARGSHRLARPLHAGEASPMERGADTTFVPDGTLADGTSIVGEGWRLQTVETPGHTANHLAFALEGTGILFSGDHVMAWATTVIAPPDGSMADYMASLDRLLVRGDTLLLPGHGGAVDDPATFMRALKAHRRMREHAILQRVRAGDREISTIVANIYRSTDRRLHGAAALSVFAHMEALVARGLVQCEGAPTLAGIYEAV